MADPIPLEDPLFKDAAKFIRETGVASTAALQSQFDLGHPRAVRLMKQLEDRNVVGPYVSGEGRKVMAPSPIDETSENDGRGTFYVSVTIRKPQDGSNADRMTVGYWPGTKAGCSPPATWEDAFAHALTTVQATKGLPCDGVCEIRITTFEQGSEDDYLTERGDE